MASTRRDEHMLSLAREIADAGLGQTRHELQSEIVRLRQLLDQAETRAATAEEQLLRVHRAVRAARVDARSARDTRNEMLETARRHATELVAQAESEAAAMRARSEPTGEPDWKQPDPTLDDRFEAYLETELEPDRSRGWILGERTG